MVSFKAHQPIGALRIHGMPIGCIYMWGVLQQMRENASLKDISSRLGMLHSNTGGATLIIGIYQLGKLMGVKK